MPKPTTQPDRPDTTREEVVRALLHSDRAQHDELGVCAEGTQGRRAKSGNGSSGGFVHSLPTGRTHARPIPDYTLLPARGKV